MRILTYLFGIFVAIIALLLIISSFPIKGNYQIMIVQSGSMEPEIKTGSIVVVKPASEYKVGDVITFGPAPKGKVPTTHRIVDVRLQTGVPVFVTKGDANEDSDTKEVSSRNIIGKVLFDLPYIGYALAVAKKPVGFAVLIVVPALFILFDEGKKIVVEIRRLRKQKEESPTN